jgi:DNA-binding IclR family transcriptional regulator
MDSVNSIVRGIRVLDILKESGPLSYSSLTKKIDIPKSTLFKILATLEKEELIRKDPDNQRYRLGVKLIEWGSIARAGLEIRNIARPIMKDLNKELDATIHLTVLAHGEVLPIESIEQANWYQHHFTYSTTVGIPAPLHCTGAGKAILAFLDDGNIENIINVKGLGKYTSTTITDKKALWIEIAAIRQKGYAVSNGEHDEIIRSIAAPVFNAEGRVVAALSALGVIFKMTPERIQEISEIVVAGARSLSSQIGFRESAGRNFTPSK